MNPVTTAAKVGATAVALTGAVAAMTVIAAVGGTVKAAEVGYDVARELAAAARRGYRHGRSR